MLFKLPRLWSALLTCMILMSSTAQAGVFKGNPYQDRHFNSDSTPRSGSSRIAATKDGSVSGLAPNIAVPTQPALTQTGSLFNSSNGVLRPGMNAFLRLLIPDDLHVEINGQSTRPQTLAGIHHGSRFFSLEGLDANGENPCVIVVDYCDQFGNMMRMRRVLSIQAGEQCEVRFPDRFEPFWVLHSETVVTPQPSFQPLPSPTPVVPTHPQVSPPKVDLDETRGINPIEIPLPF